MTSSKRGKYLKQLNNEQLDSLFWSSAKRLRTLINQSWIVWHTVGINNSDAETVLSEISGLNGRLIALLREASRRKISLKQASPSTTPSID